MKTLILTTLAVLGLVASANAAPMDRTMMDRPGHIATQDELPGWTGRTFVRGTHSSIAGDADATRWFQTGQF